MKTHSYESARGLLLGTTYTVVEGTAATTARSYAYNHLGQLTQVVDDAGTRSISYNEYGEQESDSLNAGNHTHLITEQRDSYGRSTGYTYARSGAQQHRVTIGYGTDGRIATAGFLHGNSEKQFSYGYLSGSNLLQTLTMPNNMTLTQSYETQRDLLTGMSYKRGNTPVAERIYSYDTLGRPLTRSTTRSGQSTISDSFGYNTRSELVSATVNGDNYAYDYDNIGNRTSATEVGDITAYASNNLNQYTAIQTGEEAIFTPTFDADGNQTLVKTSTGIWAVQYNAENRPVSFTNSASNTVVECTYDSMGRRHTRKITVSGNVTSYLRYIYRGYLQIAAIDAISGTFQWFLVWDPTQPIATRPLAIRKDRTWYAYGWDLTKNICEVFGPAGYIRTAYTYTPYGEVTILGDVTQPIRWGSEYFDIELGIYYYNYRTYNPLCGIWFGRDLLEESEEMNLYGYAQNSPAISMDYMGLSHNMDFLSMILEKMPPSIGAVYYSGRVWVFPVPVFPMVTIEIYVNIGVNIMKCCNKDSSLGLLIVGKGSIEITGGIGTSIGGTSNVRAERTKKGKIRYRNGKGGSTGRGGTFSKSPTVQNYGVFHSAVAAHGVSVSNGSGKLPECECPIMDPLTVSIGISGIASADVPIFRSYGILLDSRFGECKFPGGCRFENPLESTSLTYATGQGTGARIAVYGRGETSINYKLI